MVATKTKLYHQAPEQRQKLIGQLQTALNIRNDVCFAYLYGSFIEELPFHDIDVGVYLKNTSKGQSAVYAVDLATSLGKQLGLPVDVRVLNDAPIPFVYQVLRGHLLTEQDSDIRSHFTENIVTRYLDLKPLLRQATKEAFAT